MLKQLTLTILVCLIVLQTAAQRKNTDSLWRVFENTQNDSVRLLAVTTLHNYYIRIDIDSNVYYSQRLMQICNKLNQPRYNALGLVYASFIYYRFGDYKRMQELVEKAATIEAENSDHEVLARIENCRSILETDPNKKIEHLRKAIQFKRALIVIDQPSNIFLASMSNAFLATDQTDSAFFYAQKMYEMSVKRNDTLSSYFTATMGNVYLKMNQPDIAYAFYLKGIRGAIQSQKTQDLMSAYIPMGNYFDKMNQPDSALYYWKKPFETGPREAFLTKFNCSKKIYDYYYKKGNSDSAAKYMNFYIVANDSINSTNKVAQLQAAKFEDQLRQQELEKARATDKENRNHNLQLAVTAIAILVFLILFLLLSRSILVSHKAVAFLNVVVLLVVFEFINLLMHPFLERVTHHSPVLMLLALVAIAALIVPLHHRLEHWTTKKLVEKNKAIRLAKAKKTIEELGAPEDKT